MDQLALDVAARQMAGDVAQAVATALLPMASTSDLAAAVALRTTPADVSQLIATALLPYVQQTAVDAALALRDARLDGHDAEILALQGAGPFATPGDLNALETAAERDRRHPGAAGRPEHRRQQPHQRPPLAGPDHLRPAGRHKSAEKTCTPWRP